MSVPSFQIDPAVIGDRPSIESRAAELPEADRKVFVLALSYLFLPDGPRSITREEKALAERLLNPDELFVFNWLHKRTDGKLKRMYGATVLDTVKRARYRCETCGFADVRALNLEKGDYDEATKSQGFVCLCANCNTVAARAREMELVAANKKQAEVENLARAAAELANAEEVARLAAQETEQQNAAPETEQQSAAHDAGEISAVAGADLGVAEADNGSEAADPGYEPTDGTVSGGNESGNSESGNSESTRDEPQLLADKVEG